ncbi:hypothetical protein TRVL_03792 [Trypanosoma vivax]|nr:hypothetical protein TRVL_03792 [Trypanosoma vivax]
MDWSLFKGAIEDSDEPTPVYMYREMAQWTFDDHGTQASLINALMHALKSSASVHVLYKVLRIIKVICETGHSDFQRELQNVQRAEDIRTLTYFCGSLDARHGDQLNEKVRKAAQEALKAVFAEGMEERSVSKASHERSQQNTSGIGGTGATRFTGELSVFSLCSTGGMPIPGGNIAPMPSTNKWAEEMVKQASVTNVGSAAKGLLSTLAEKATRGLEMLMHQETGRSVSRTSKSQLYQEALRLSVTGGGLVSLASSQENVAEPRFPQSRPSSTPPCSAGGNAGSSSWNFINGFVGGSVSSSQEDAKAAADFQQPPKSLTPFGACVQRLCQMKETPRRVELHAFVTECIDLVVAQMNETREQEGGLSLDFIKGQKDEAKYWAMLAEVLCEQLAQKFPWQWRLNALLALEAVLTSRSDERNIKVMQQEVTRYFRENSEGVQRNVLVVQATLRECAKRVLDKLELPSPNTMADPVSLGASVFSQAQGTPPVQLPDTAGHNLLSSHAGSQGTDPLTSTDSNVASHSAADIGSMEIRRKVKSSSNKTTLKKRPLMWEAQQLASAGEGSWMHKGYDYGSDDRGETCALERRHGTPFVGSAANPLRTRDIMDELFGPSMETSGGTSRTWTTPSISNGSTDDADNANTRSSSLPRMAVCGVPSSVDDSGKAVSLFEKAPHPQPAINSALFQLNANCVTAPGSVTDDDMLIASRTPSFSEGSNAALSKPQEFLAISQDQIVQMQKHLQSFMSNLPHDVGCTTQRQLGVLAQQQQRLLSFLAQQNQQQGCDVPNSANVSTCGHTHFMMGNVSPHLSSNAAAGKALAEMQQEMMRLASVQQPTQTAAQSREEE